MTEKEKAKAYDEAIERAKKSYGNGITEEIFPELKEDDTERIRKWIIDDIRYNMNNEPLNNSEYKKKAEKAIAWLEKQGEQKPTLPKWKYKKDNTPLLRDSIILNKYGGVAKSPSGAIVSDAWVLDYDELAKLPKEEKIEPKFKVGDWIISSVLGTARIIGVNDSNEFQLEYIDGKQEFSSIDYVNYAYDKWTIQVAKNGDVLATSSGPFIYNGKYDGSSCPGCYCGINTLGRFERCICETNWTSKKVYPATKEQRDALMKAMNYVGYKWNAETKTFKRLDKPKFDLKTLQPFDKVLVKVDSYWRIELFSNMYEYMDDIYYACARGSYKECIPYNDETKHLLGTSDEAPEYYRYWED